MSNTRRQFLKQGACFTTLSTLGLSSACQSGNTPAAAVHPSPSTQVEWPVLEGPNTPKICTGVSRNADASAMRSVKQIGLDHVLMGGPPIPWDQTELQSVVDRIHDGGLLL